MSGFAFSHQFGKHWLNTPEIIRHAILQELHDIIRLLEFQQPVSEFHFTYSDLSMQLHKYEKEQTLCETPDEKKGSQTENLESLAANIQDKNIQQQVIHDIEQKLDDYLSEQMALISEDLKIWLKTEIQQRLNKS